MGNALAKKIELLLAKSERKLLAATDAAERGHYEDAVSRAYYAMFHAAQAMLLTKHLESKTHFGVIQLLAKNFVEKGPLDYRFQKMLTNGKTLREFGDY